MISDIASTTFGDLDQYPNDVNVQFRVPTNSFGNAVDWMKRGNRVTRSSVNGAWLIYLAKFPGFEPCFVIESQDKKTSRPGWMPTIEDILADDWIIA